MVELAAKEVINLLAETAQYYRDNGETDVQAIKSLSRQEDNRGATRLCTPNGDAE